MQTLFLLFVVCGIVTILVALPMIADKIKPNPFYGFRIKATLENPELWYAVNKYFAIRLLVVGLVELLAAIILYLLPGLSVDTYALSVMLVFVVTFGLAMSQTMRYLKSLK